MQKNNDNLRSAEAKRLILIADDEKEYRDHLGKILSPTYDIIYAEDGNSAMRMLRENADTLSLAIIDLIMPEKSGLNILQLMVNDSELNRIPVIITTSDRPSEIDSLEIAFDLGAADFMPKPFPQNGVIYARVKHTIELSENRRIISSTERDPLTGLYTRDYFFRYAENFDVRHKDTPTDAIVIDIFHFHIINERFGTAYGDNILLSIAAQLRDFLGEEAIICRMDADTFMIYCPHGINYKKLLGSATAALSADSFANTRVRIRMGVYENTDKSLPIERRFDRAKSAADNARNQLSGYIGFYDRALHEKQMFAEQLIGDFSAGIEQGQFKVYYQPKFDVRLDVPLLCGAEALVRWEHPTLGVIMPTEFVPLFEENGLIRELDEYVWRIVARQIADWRKRLGFALPLSVNISRVDMYDTDIVDTLKNVIDESHINTTDITLEITESAYTKETDQIIESVTRLRALGFNIEMDDFGTGYSTLNLISTLPLDSLKLDMSFVRQAFTEHHDTKLLEVIIDLADYLEVPVIAEGVETKEQLDALKVMGCDIVQGFYFSKPVSTDKFEEFIVDMGKMSESRSAKYSDIMQSIPERKGASFEKISRALAGGYENIYYIDVESNHFVKFVTSDKFDALEIERSGSDFFDEMKGKVPKSVYIDDRAKILDALKKRTLLMHIAENRSFSMIYRVMVNSIPTYYQLKAVKAKSQDNRHIIIGITNIHEQVALSEITEFEKSTSFSLIAQALSQDYFCIYYVNIKNNRFVEYSANPEYHELMIDKSGDNFFKTTAKNLMRVIHPDDVEMVSEMMTKKNVLARLKDKRTFTVTYRLMLESKPTYVHLKATRMKDGEHIVIGISDIDEQIRREQDYEKALRMARKDALTGVKNHNAYIDEEKEIDRAIADGSAPPFALVVCDINNLKHINDTFGHNAGNACIKNACNVICSVFKNSPVFRIGGDEFAVILRGEDFENRAELIKEIHSRNRIAEQNDEIIVACGIADFHVGDEKLADVFERADANMYEDKESHKADGQ